MIVNDLEVSDMEGGATRFVDAGDVDIARLRTSNLGGPSVKNVRTRVTIKDSDIEDADSEE